MCRSIDKIFSPLETEPEYFDLSFPPERAESQDVLTYLHRSRKTQLSRLQVQAGGSALSLDSNFEEENPSDEVCN